MEQKIKISQQMVILDVISEFPQAETVFKSYDAQVGECVCCQMLFATVGEMIEKYHLDGEKLLSELNRAADSEE